MKINCGCFHCSVQERDLTLELINYTSYESSRAIQINTEKSSKTLKITHQRSLLLTTSTSLCVMNYKVKVWFHQESKSTKANKL